MARRMAQQAEPPKAAPPKAAMTQIQIRDDVVLGYRLKILLYDLQNLNQNPQSAKRLNATTDVHYLSEPYFTPEQADAVKQAAVCEINQDETTGYILTKPMIGRTVQEAIQLHLGGFLAKRQASNDKRPAAPTTFYHCIWLCLDWTRLAWKTRGFGKIEKRSAQIA